MSEKFSKKRSFGSDDSDCTIIKIVKKTQKDVTVEDCKVPAISNGYLDESITSDCSVGSDFKDISHCIEGNNCEKIFKKSVEEVKVKTGLASHLKPASCSSVTDEKCGDEIINIQEEEDEWFRTCEEFKNCKQTSSCSVSPSLEELKMFLSLEKENPDPIPDHKITLAGKVIGSLLNSEISTNSCHPSLNDGFSPKNNTVDSDLKNIWKICSNIKRNDNKYFADHDEDKNIDKNSFASNALEDNVKTTKCTSPQPSSLFVSSDAVTNNKSLICALPETVQENIESDVVQDHDKSLNSLEACDTITQSFCNISEKDSQLTCLVTKNDATSLSQHANNPSEAKRLNNEHISVEISGAKASRPRAALLPTPKVGLITMDNTGITHQSAVNNQSHSLNDIQRMNLSQSYQVPLVQTGYQNNYFYRIPQTVSVSGMPSTYYERCRAINRINNQHLLMTQNFYSQPVHFLTPGAQFLNPHFMQLHFQNLPKKQNFCQPTFRSFFPASSSECHQNIPTVKSDCCVHPPLPPEEKLPPLPPEEKLPPLPDEPPPDDSYMELPESEMPQFSPASSSESEALPGEKNEKQPKLELHKLNSKYQNYRKSTANAVGVKVMTSNEVLAAILSWNVQWFCDYAERGTFPDIFNSVKAVKIHYSNFEDYYTTYMPFVLAETWKRMYLHWNAQQHKRRDTLFQLVGSKQVENNMFLIKCCTDVHCHKSYPSEGFLVLIDFMSFNGVKFGYVHHQEYKNNLLTSKFVLHLCVKVAAQKIEDVEFVRIQILSDLKVCLTLVRSLHNIKSSPFYQSILLPTAPECKNVILKRIRATSEQSVMEAVSQIESSIALEDPSPQMIIVSAPFGTNQMIIITTLVRNIMKSRTVCGTDKTRLLLCTRGISRLQEVGANLTTNDDWMPPPEVIILEEQDNIEYPSLKKLTLEAKLYSHAKGGSPTNSNDMILSLKKRIFNKCDVFLSLVTHCYNLEYYHFLDPTGDSPVALCIIDESWMCTEPEILIPMLYGFKKLIFFGDQQTKPKIWTKIARSNDFQMPFTLRATKVLKTYT